MLDIQYDTIQQLCMLRLVFAWIHTVVPYETCGIPIHVSVNVGISISCNGQERMDARGNNLRVSLQLRVVISTSCNGPERMDARGMNIRVPLQLLVVILTSCNG